MTITPAVPALTRTFGSSAAPTALLIHGFLDDTNAWNDALSAIGDRINTVRYDLPGFGTRVDEVSDPTGLSLDDLIAEATAVLHSLPDPVIVVGHSLGSQIAQAIADAHPESVQALVLLTPLPLNGSHLPEESISALRHLGGSRDAQRAARSSASPALSDQQLDRLTHAGNAVRPDITNRYVDLFNNGTTTTAHAYPGPVRLIRGDADTFVTDQLVDAITTRYPRSTTAIINGGGHWLHIEQPRRVAEIIVETADLARDESANSGWRTAFSRQSAQSFAESFAEQVVLDATVLRAPVRGRHQVAAVMHAASAIYETLDFTAQTTDGDTSYLQWRATAFGGIPINGVTLLRRNADDQIFSAAIHHRPLDVAMRFSAELRDRLHHVIPADHFIGEDFEW